MPNVYKKFCPHVFLVESDEEYQRGDEIIVTTRRGTEHECVVFNLVRKGAGKFQYSVVRADGFNYQEFARRRAERHEGYAQNAEARSDAYYEASNEGRDFLSLGEPIKVGHHSEGRHRALIERNHNRMEKSIEEGKKAKAHRDKASYWDAKTEDVNLSMPESLEFFKEKLEVAKEYHAGVKSGKYPREHSYTLTYARKSVKDLEEKVKLAEVLWGDKKNEEEK